MLFTRFLLPLFLALLPLTATAQADKPLAGEREKTSYMIGLDVGNSLVAAGPDIDLAAFEATMRKGLAGEKPGMDEAQAKATAVALMQRMQARKAGSVDKAAAVDRVAVGVLAGADVGAKLAQIRDEIEVAAFMRGLRASWGTGKSALDDAELAGLRQALAARLQQKALEQGERNAAEGERFLAGNRNAKGVVTTRSGLQYLVLRQGSGARPLPTARVRVNYEGRLLDGTVFDSSYQRGEPMEFALNQVSPGWTEGLSLMPIGAKYRFWVPAEIGYGKRGSPPSIGPGQTLVFDVELMDILK